MQSPRDGQEEEEEEEEKKSAEKKRETTREESEREERRMQDAREQEQEHIAHLSSIEIISIQSWAAVKNLKKKHSVDFSEHQPSSSRRCRCP